MVYTLTLNAATPRIFEVTTTNTWKDFGGGKGHSYGVSPSISLRPPPVMHAFHEAREELIKRTQTPVSAYLLGEDESLFFNPAIDTLYFPICIACFVLQFQEQMSNVRRVMVLLDSIAHAPEPMQALLLIKNVFPHLEYLCIETLRKSCRHYRAGIGVDGDMRSLPCHFPSTYRQEHGLKTIEDVEDHLSRIFISTFGRNVKIETRMTPKGRVWFGNSFIST
jgi:hypothetical protein